ncbi:RHS repeat-associated core domain-containing protein [Pseudomonas sp. 37 R 15]|uniref:RHS repeat-associated core domain-containing protein n=1 Tax=Pseudomonas sp. 37 R 15 TaxID=1844104 RepID=UPI003531923B
MCLPWRRIRRAMQRHLGTPQELTTPDGEIVWSAHHRAYGEISRLDVGKIDNPLRFQGQYYDQESGLHYNRHRYYHPNIGRYLTPDPVKLAGGINGYQYVPNPTGWVDPLD